MDKNCLPIEYHIESLNLATNNQASPVKADNSEQCYTLLQAAAGDKETQKNLQRERLKNVLQQLQHEREDSSFSRNCLFCKKHFTGNRTVLFDHLLQDHNFSVGAPDNLVFVNELLDYLEHLLKNLQCFYCEKVFTDWMTLKEHMRKKQHKRINPENKHYDRFYVINYLEIGKSWVDFQDIDDKKEEKLEDIEMMDLEDESNSYVCLFCENKTWDFDEILMHMKDEHGFDFKYIKQTQKLDFYQQIKLINYIRKKVYDKECIICDSKFCIQEDLVEHMIETQHISTFPDPTKWDDQLYFFSTFDNDNLLCGLDVDDVVGNKEYVVLPEELDPPAFNEVLLQAV